MSQVIHIKLCFGIFWHFDKGCSRFFPTRIDAQSARKSKQSFWGVVLIILVIIVIIFVKFDSFSSKSSHQQRPAGLLPSFCCWNCQFWQKNHSNYQNNEDVLHDFQGAAAAFSGENWRQKCQKVEKSLFLAWLSYFFAFLCFFAPRARKTAPEGAK